MADLAEKISARIQRGDDMAGVVAAGDCVISAPCQILKWSDGYFPKRFEISVSTAEVNLRGSTFLGSVKINRKVDRSFDISESIIKEDIVFAPNQTFGNVRFDSCVINGRAVFRDAIFRRHVSFTKCIFGGFAHFQDVNFEDAETISFESAKFEKSVSFRSLKSRSVGRIFFQGAEFSDEVGFEGRAFKSSLNFKSCIFHRAPRFHDAEVSFECIFPELKCFLDWRKIPAEYKKLSARNRSEYYERAAQSYRTLRYAMKSQDAYDEEAKFWELEMRAKERALRWRSGEWLPKFFSLLYAASARYGNSIGRPIVLWVGIFCGFAVLFGMLWGCDETFGAQQAMRLVDFSLQQTTRPFAVWSEDGRKALIHFVFGGCSSPTDGDILAVRLFATLESIVALTFIALFGFALRRRFRMA